MKYLGHFIALVAASAVAHPVYDEPDHGSQNRLLNDAILERQSCSGPVATNPSTWWRAAIQHNGTTPLSTDPTFEYYRTAVQYGADPTGVNDSSSAFNFAINAWSRAGNTVTTRPAYVYIPPGKYRIANSIQMYVSTYLIGDAVNPPTLFADPALGTNPVINGSDGLQGQGSSTKNFYMAVRNVIIDTTALPASSFAVGMDWSVSQGCSLTNVDIHMPNFSNHTGITMLDGGSGTIISDSNFQGGAVGIRLNNEQYQLKNLSFNGCTVGISLQHVFVATVQGATFQNCDFGIDMTEDVAGVSLVDSSVSNCNAAVQAPVTGNAHNSLVIDELTVSGGGTQGVKAPDGSSLLTGGVPAGQVWVLGNLNDGNYQQGSTQSINRPAALVQNGKYFTMAQPQYQQYALDQFISVKGDPEFPVYGDNQHNDGPNINAILQKYAGCKIVFFPQGLYLTLETIVVPAGTRMVGEVLSTITANGSAWYNSNAPQPILRVGSPGDTGVAQISDMLVQTSDVLQGAILAEVNIAGAAPGDVGFWNVVLRVGGTVDSKVNTNCAGADTADCKAAAMLMHLTARSSVYLENVWGWVADHSLDGGPPQNIAVGRGLLVEATAGTWLVGTAFEHSTMYQYSLNAAANVFVGMAQTEAPYWQGQGSAELAPAPFTVNATLGDPTFSNCAAQGLGSDDRCFRAWGLHMSGSSNVVIHGSALWSFFNDMVDGQFQDSGCGATGGVCEDNMAYIGSARSTYWFNAQTKSSANMIYDVTQGTTTVSQNDNGAGFGGVLAAYLQDA